MKPSARGQLLWRLADLMEAHADKLAEIESLDNGKPVTVARAGDVPLAIDMFLYMAGMATKVRGSMLNLSSPGDYHSYILREPVGVVGQIIPWNFPLLMAAWKPAPALAAGCTVVLKPAEQTPLSALRLGKLIARAATGNLKKVTLELGGKSPVIAFPDAGLDRTVPGAASAIFFNQGQNGSGAGGDLRPRAGRLALRRRPGPDRQAGERHDLRSGRVDLDQLPQRVRRLPALRRLQAVRLEPRDRRGGAAQPPGSEGGHGGALSRVWGRAARRPAA